MRGLEITTPNGAICVVQQLGTTGIETIHQEAEVHIYPNPTNGQVHLEYPSGCNARTIYITNYLGEIIKTESADLNQLDLSDCANGIYILVIEDDNNRKYSYRVVKD